MSTIYESMNKGFENKYGAGEHGYNSPKTKIISEKTTPEERANSDRLRELDRKIYIGKDLTNEELKFIDDMGFEVRDFRLVPKDTPKGKEYIYGVKGENRSRVEDATGLKRKVQRAFAGTTNPYHREGRTSYEKERLSRELDNAERWGKERSKKIFQARLNQEEQRLKDIRKRATYQNLEREKEAREMEKPLTDFKKIQGALSPESEDELGYRKSNVEGRRAAIADRRAEARQRYEDEIATLDKQTQDIDAWEAELRAEKDRLLRRNPKNESLLKEDAYTIEDVEHYIILIEDSLNFLERKIQKGTLESSNHTIKTLERVLDLIDALNVSLWGR